MVTICTIAGGFLWAAEKFLDPRVRARQRNSSTLLVYVLISKYAPKFVGVHGRKCFDIALTRNAVVISGHTIQWPRG